MEVLYIVLGAVIGVYVSNRGASSMHERIEQLEADNKVLWDKVKYLRHYSKTLETMLNNKSRTPPPNWMVALGLNPGFTKADVIKAYRQRAMKYHPDLGGTDSDMAALNAARDRAMVHAR